MDREDFIFPPSERSERYLIIEIDTFEGRSVETKKDPVRQISTGSTKRPGSSRATSMSSSPSSRGTTGD